MTGNNDLKKFREFAKKYKEGKVNTSSKDLGKVDLSDDNLKRSQRSLKKVMEKTGLSDKKFRKLENT